MIEFSVESVLEEITPIWENRVAIYEGKVKLEKPLSYFARAIRGGRGNLENCRITVSEMEKYSTVLSKHTILDDVDVFEKEWGKRFPEINVRTRDLTMINLAKYFVADITEESTGVGYEIYEAQFLKKPSALFCHEKAKNRPTMLLYTDRLIKPSFEELLNLHGIKISIHYYNDQNIKEVAEREIRNLFTKL